jgi:hypothetical protein
MLMFSSIHLSSEVGGSIRGGIPPYIIIYACITVQAYLHYGYIAAAFLNCGCITCISVQQNFELGSIVLLESKVY